MPHTADRVEDKYIKLNNNTKIAENKTCIN